MVITVEVTYSEADYARALRFMSRRQIRIFNCMIVIGAVVFALLLYRADPAAFHWWAMPAIAGLGIFFFGLIRLSHRWGIGRQLKSMPSAQGPHLWEISDDGIKATGPLSSVDMKWQAILRVRESKDDFLFYTATRFSRFLPKRVFANEEEIGDLRRLIIEKLGPKAELT